MLKTIIEQMKLRAEALFRENTRRVTLFSNNHRDIQTARKK